MTRVGGATVGLGDSNWKTRKVSLPILAIIIMIVMIVMIVMSFPLATEEQGPAGLYLVLCTVYRMAIAHHLIPANKIHPSWPHSPVFPDPYPSMYCTVHTAPQLCTHPACTEPPPWPFTLVASVFQCFSSLLTDDGFCGGNAKRPVDLIHWLCLPSALCSAVRPLAHLCCLCGVMDIVVYFMYLQVCVLFSL